MNSFVPSKIEIFKAHPTTVCNPCAKVRRCLCNYDIRKGKKFHSVQYAAAAEQPFFKRKVTADKPPKKCMGGILNIFLVLA